MIGRLRGIVAEIGEDECLIDVGGVGYVVRCGARTLSRLPPVGEETVLHTENPWSEQIGPQLYGFLARDERRAFVLLRAIQGVGPKAAMAVLDVASPAELAGAIARDDKALIGRANGVGPKLAQRIVTELKDKPISDGPAIFAPNTAAPRAAAPSATGEAVSALMGLGVAEPMARRVIEQASLRLGEEADVSALIKAGLQELGR
ncbi:Holliday junction branch migration protein RuvA [Caulobacter sp. NIBR1757]|uniref:Holliday junction branch migration protein RuvA n=1 Tax=Caulobacter sp. NIBR1757 TaxID=3016000 RepID=UPI0022F0F04F|nr:Holliday junction branch migration protein RuvA [Caulobacter sp. NIBR1757]WGM37995.1 Holliday junction ATP-dependent DNA helicase RuvA [Caulobacter sp. NIBR1757]